MAEGIAIWLRLLPGATAELFPSVSEATDASAFRQMREWAVRNEPALVLACDDSAKHIVLTLTPAADVLGGIAHATESNLPFLCLDRIQHALKDSAIEVTADKVAYRDFTLDGTPVPRTDLDGVLLYSRAALAHEQEVRLYVTQPPKQQRAGLGIRVDVSDLLDEVIVSPRADLATLRAVCALGATYALRVPVRPSMLLDGPR